MDDDNFAPDFNDDFLNEPPDYAFDDDDEGFYLSTVNKQPNEVEVLDHQEGFANENDQPAIPQEDTSRKRHYSSDLPLGAHPLDWFVNSEFDTATVKRKKIEASEFKRQFLLDKIISKKAQLDEAQLSSTAIDHPVQTSSYLRIKPSNGSSFYQLASPECFSIGYVEVFGPDEMLRPKRVEPSKRRLLIPSVNDSLVSTQRNLSSISKIPKKKKMATSNELWAEKYQPRAFLELLTESEHSKVMMAWLELWDQHVFKRTKNYEIGLNDYYKSMLETEEAMPYLPKKKFLFLYGPSGCSKSTLAKICALQAGYRPAFIDASDYPNKERFLEALPESTGNPKISFTAGSYKPVCPIIENVDGANDDVIKCLLDNFASDKSTKKKKKHGDIVRRPIILVSSNFFVPSIRKLRPFCFVVHIAALNKKRTINRLEKICALEGLEIKRTILIDMYEQCNCDLRQCLNNLQYLCSLWWKDVEFSKEFNVRVSEYSMFDALNQILTTNPHYSGNKLLPPRQRAQNISNILSRRSDVDTLYHAIFYNTMIISKLRSTQRLKVCNFLTDDDLINSFMRHSQQWTLLRYTNTAGILIHFAVANYTSKRLVYNLGFMRYKDKVRESRETIGKCLEAIKPRFSLTSCGLQLDLLPALYSVIQPSCYMAATQIQFCNLEETQIINRIVEVMSFYGLSYSSTFENMELDLRLEPSIESIAVYSALNKDKVVGTLNTNAKRFINQLLSRKQIESEAIQRIDKLTVSRGKSQGSTELLEDHQRVPGLAMLKRNQGFSTAKDVVYITSTKLLYRQGNSQAIRINVLNKSLFSFF